MTAASTFRARFRSGRTLHFTESVIREMTRLAIRHGATNLAQGFPDFRALAEVKSAAAEAVAADINQYAITWGAKPLRDAIAAKYARTYGIHFDAEREITVCCGATEGMIASLLAVVDPGDEVVLFEPFYENYGPDSQLCGATSRYVTLHPPDVDQDGALTHAGERDDGGMDGAVVEDVLVDLVADRQSVEFLAKGSDGFQFRAGKHLSPWDCSASSG